MRPRATAWLLCAALSAPPAVAGAAVLPPCNASASGTDSTMLTLPAKPDWSQGGLGITGASLLYHVDDDAYWRRPQAYEGLRAAHIGALRFPGGELADNYDWERHAVERAADWPGEAATAQGRAARTDFREFIAHAAQAGVGDVFLVVNLDGAFRAAGERRANIERYAQAAARWVAAVNGAGAPLSVHWEIGNEPYLGGSYPLTAREYAQALTVFAAAMRAADPQVRIGAAGPGTLGGVGFADRLGAPALSRLRAGAGNSRRACPGLTTPACIATLQQGDPVPAPEAWWPTVMQLAAGSFDYAVLHRYARATPLGAAGFPLSERTHRLRRALQQAAGRPVPLALTEWNTPSEKRHAALSGMAHLIELAIQRGNDAVAGVDHVLYWPLRTPGPGHRPLLDDDGSPTAVAHLFALFHQLADAEALVQHTLAGDVYVLRTRGPQARGYLVVNAGAQDRIVELDDAGAAAVTVQQIISGAAGNAMPLPTCNGAGIHPSATRVHAPAGSISLIRSVPRTNRL